MIVRIFHAGTSRGESPVRYLLSDVDHQGEERAIQPEVLEGQPETTIQIINSISRKHKYVSGVIAFRDEEQPSREQMYQVMDAFKATVLPGLSPDQYNNLWVLHREKGNTELHFVVPMQEMTTGRRLNIHPPGPKNIELYQAFTQVMNQSLGYGQVLSDPLKVPLTDFERKAPTGADSKRNANQLHSEIRQAILSGAVNNREQLCQFLDESLGVTITRKGANYLSVKLPGQAKAIRLKGELFEEGTDYLGCCRFQRHFVKVVDETGGGLWKREGNSAASSSLRRCDWSGSAGYRSHRRPKTWMCTRTCCANGCGRHQPTRSMPSLARA